MTDSPLSPMVLRNLGDRSYEKRKQAALDIERTIKSLNDKPKGKDGKAQIKAIIKLLVEDYAYATQSNHRKGGLIGLAATAIALMDDTVNYLASLLPPVLKCFSDQDSRVRYYACEALYNITKVARGNVLLFFNEIFDGLCKLYSDPDIDVKNGAQLLDRLLKDVVTECDLFDVDKFIPLLKERIRIQDPYIRQLLVGWITVLDSVPDIDMLEYLPEFLGGLFDMLSDKNKDIKQLAFRALGELLGEIRSSSHIDLGKMVMILVQQCRHSRDNFTRLTVLDWLATFVHLGKSKLLKFCVSILGAALSCISHKEKEISEKAMEINESLLRLVETTQEDIALGPLLSEVTAHLKKLNRSVRQNRVAALKWITMLLKKMPGKLFNYLNELFPALLKTLHDSDDEVIRLDLEVLARISLDKENRLDQKNFEMVLSQLITVFTQDRKLLEQRGALIIRNLSVLLDGESIYRAFATILVNTKDLDFARLMVQTLNLILLTSPELFELRGLLKQSLYTNRGKNLFITLYQAWCHNPISTLSLCLLAQAYELAAALVFQIANIEVTVSFLMQLDKLVQLIESPIFIHLRLQLLEPARYPFLLKTLYGMLMLLPQSSAFNSLKIRLESVSPLGLLNCIPDSDFAMSSKLEINWKDRIPDKQQWPPEKPKKETDQLEFRQLLHQFVSVQQLHQGRMKHIFHMNSLLLRSIDLSDNSKQKAVASSNTEESV